MISQQKRIFKQSEYYIIKSRKRKKRGGYSKYIRNWVAKEYLSAENKEKEGYIYRYQSRKKKKEKLYIIQLIRIYTSIIIEGNYTIWAAEKRKKEG